MVISPCTVKIFRAFHGGALQLRYFGHLHPSIGLEHPSIKAAKHSGKAAGSLGKASPAKTATSKPPGLHLPPSLSLRLKDLWQRYFGAAVVSSGSLATYGLWHATLSVGSLFTDMSGASPGAAALGASAAVVAASGWYIHSYHSLKPEKAYALALKQLQASPELIEVMGTPLVGNELHMAVLVGGGIYLRDLRMRRRCPRVLMAFRLAGPNRQGLVTLDAKKRNGQYVFKLLSVDVQGGPEGVLRHGEGSTTAEGAARIYLRGGPEEYSRGGVVEDMRKPYIGALNATGSYEAEDEMDDELDRLAVPPATSEPGAISPWWRRWRQPERTEEAESSGSAGPPSIVPGLRALWGLIPWGGSRPPPHTPSSSTSKA